MSHHPIIGRLLYKAGVTTCDDVQFLFHFTFYLSRVLLQSVTWLMTFLSHMTHLESYITFSRDSLSYDLHWLRLTHSDSLVFHPFVVSVIAVSPLFRFTYIWFIFCFMTHMRTSIVLVTYCSSDIIVLCDVHCSCDSIVLIYYKVRPSK